VVSVLEEFFKHLKKSKALREERKRTPFPFWPWRASSVKIGSWRMS
jgi:hypothetical protein